MKTYEGYTIIRGLNRYKDLLVKRNEDNSVSIAILNNDSFKHGEIVIREEVDIKKLLTNMVQVMREYDNDLSLDKYYTEDDIRLKYLREAKDFGVRDALRIELIRYDGDHESSISRITISKDSARQLYKLLNIGDK